MSMHLLENRETSDTMPKMNTDLQIERANCSAADAGKAQDEKEIDPVRLRKMSENLTLVLRMAAMEMLREETDGFVLEIGSKTLHLTEAGTLFDAYLKLYEMYDGDFGELAKAVDGYWRATAIEMVLNPQAYISVWRWLRIGIIGQSLPLLARNDEEKRAERDSRFFTALSIGICDNVIKTLSGGDKAKPE